MPGAWAHLVARFVDVALARSLRSTERNQVAQWLEPELRRLFFAQPPADQRHGYRAAQVVLGSGSDDHDLVVAALLHDVGKRHSRLGLFGRSLASVMIRLGLPMPRRVRTYRDHGVIGAQELAKASAPGLAVDFAMHHHGARPESIPAQRWALLKKADRPAKPGEWLGGWITSTRR